MREPGLDDEAEPARLLGEVSELDYGLAARNASAPALKTLSPTA
jgi:hypothetical protein